MAADHSLPKTHRALVLRSTTTPPSVESVPTPQATAGSAVVRILAAVVIPYMRDIYDGTRKYAFPTPLVIGSNAVGRVAAVGPDATKLAPGQLVLVDSTIRSRDDPTGAIFLAGVHEGFTDGSRKLMHGEWRDATFAEYAKVPLENCVVLDEKRLLGSVEDGGLGYTLESLLYITVLLVPFGGLRDINLQAGETVIVAPATGSFGGAAVVMALAMGARVIAMGRNVDALKKVAALSERVEVVPITGDVQTDLKALKSFGPIDAFFEISPPMAAKATFIETAILALRPHGRVSFMGGIGENVPLPLSAIMHRNLLLKGTWMYTREAIVALIKLVERGVLKLGERSGARVVGKFGLDEWDAAFTTAAKNSGVGLVTAITP